MLEHVLKMERGLTRQPLDFCNHSTSHGAAIHCSAERSSNERVTLEARFAAIPKTPALEQLREAADRFLGSDAAWRAEEHRGGTMYAYAENEYRITNEQEFVELLESGRAPAASEAEVKKLDAELNAAYKKRMDSIEPCESNCDPPLEPEILRGSQRAWIPYRDAWIRYYQERWKGQASPDQLRREIAAKLMRARIAQFALPGEGESDG